jgi:hypothetical protein
VIVKTHDGIDRRSLTMARRIVAKIDGDPAREGLEHARQVCARWVERENVPAKEWMAILAAPWSQIRSILLDDSEEGRRLRQNDPLVRTGSWLKRVRRLLIQVVGCDLAVHPTVCKHQQRRTEDARQQGQREAATDHDDRERFLGL